VRDVTERQLELAHVRAMQDEFVSRVSHELRTPLAAIKASIGVVLANEPDGTSDPLHRLFINIDVAAEQMNHMVANLLELARLQAGRVEIHREPCDLRALALQSIGSIEPLARRRGQEIASDMPDVTCVAPADPTHLERALVNLLSNAIRYGPANGKITVSLTCEEPEAIFGVIDEGSGVPATERDRIFERADWSEPQGLATAHGIGLGIPIARAMVELHGGRIWYETAPGGGACFRIALPLVAPVEPDAQFDNDGSDRNVAPSANPNDRSSDESTKIRYTESASRARISAVKASGERSAGEGTG
jgi:signal transduction histidine kinase